MLPKDMEKAHHWNLDQIDFANIRRELVHDDQFLFLTLTSASFVEIFANTYAKNLIQYFNADVEFTTWLKMHWQRDEVQHGVALKSYVNAVWPAFDWDRAYRGFCAEYGALCTVEKLEKVPALELIARCVVETGTSSFYRAVQSYAQEPVLKNLLGRIKNDEITHYTNFRHAFDASNQSQLQRIGPVSTTIIRRLGAIGGKDTFIAFKYAKSIQSQQELDTAWQDYHRQVRRLARHHYPYVLAVRMLIKPIPLPRLFKVMLQWPLVGLAYLFSFT